ncbi:surface polysaccharide O-acyltransferase-like enzyme [Murinocardiopsis flavida]|uniref:Surface polysaccharide O-acyltransferase-like enzyme n=1 Tax=Murinocardiopsis flavida TaxID=645275 RepID=A0A2P8DSG8_9ACTN|nr:acyltransferase family protein [Murinocardiopsis flavida]PSL00163.1 surface polysaccharide O-acyltransferase-like enzyme [Murinocardiopsis flavida]
MAATSPALAVGERGRPVGAAPRTATPAASAWLDITRNAAMLAVLVVHAFAPVVVTTYADLGSATWWTANALDSLVRWCVPVFIMISGALLLRPRDEGLRRFYTRRFSRIGIPLAAWSAVYLSWEHVRDGSTWRDALSDILSGEPALHLYFLFVLAGLYVLTPFLRLITRHAPTRMLWWFALLMSALGVADQFVVAFDDAGGPNAVTRFLPYIGYYLIGYLLRDTVLDRRQMWFAGAAVAGSAAATAFGAHALADATGGWGSEADYILDYLSPTVFVMSVAAFLLLGALGRRWGVFTDPDRDTGPARRRLKAVSDLSFGVFLVHVIVLSTLRGLTGIPDSPLGMLAMCSAHVAVVLVVSAAIVVVLRRIPVLRAIV